MYQQELTLETILFGRERESGGVGRKMGWGWGRGEETEGEEAGTCPSKN